MHPGGHRAEGAGLRAEVAAGVLRPAAPGVEVAQGREGEGPPFGAAGQLLLDEAEIEPTPSPEGERGRQVVEASVVEGDEQSDAGVRLGVQPREDGQRPLADGQRRRLVVVDQRDDRARVGHVTGHRREDQRGDVGVAEAVDDQRQPVVVFEQPEDRLVGRPQQVDLLPRPAQAEDGVGQPTVGVGDDVEHARPARPEHLDLADGHRGRIDRRRRRPVVPITVRTTVAPSLVPQALVDPGGDQPGQRRPAVVGELEHRAGHDAGSHVTNRRPPAGGPGRAGRTRGSRTGRG